MREPEQPLAVEKQIGPGDKRRDNAEPLDLTRHAYRTENAVFVTHGQYYLEIIAATELEEIFGAMFSVAQAFIRDTQVEEEVAITEKDLFPSVGQVENSFTMIASDVFGYSELDNVFIAEYDLEGTEATAFFSRRESPQAAENLAVAYHEFLLTYGGTNLEPEVTIEGARMVEIFDTYEVILTATDAMGCTDTATRTVTIDTVFDNQ